jgi:hypothetical protein
MSEQQQIALQPPGAEAPCWEHYDWWRTHLDAARIGGEGWWRPYSAGRFDSLSLADAVLAAARTGMGLVPDEHDAWHHQIAGRALVIGANMRWHGPDGPLRVPRWARGLAGYIQFAAHVTARSITDQLDGPARIAAEDLLVVLWPAPDRACSTREAGQPGRALFRAIQNYTDPDTRLPGLLELPGSA